MPTEKTIANRKAYGLRYGKCGRLKLHAEKKAKGICIQCREPVLYPHVRCKKHHEYCLAMGTKHRSKYKQAFKDQGKCTACGVVLNEDEVGKTKCINCMGRIHKPRLVPKIGG